MLPFSKLTSDPGHAYLGDGLAADIIFTLAKISGLFVIARHSSFAFKEEFLHVDDIAQELAVRFILDGQIHTSGKVLHVSVQLTDQQQGGHVWAHHFEGFLEDIFNISDKVSRKIVEVLQLELTDAEQSQAWFRGTNSFDAWLQIMQAVEQVMQGSPTSIKSARKLLQNALTSNADNPFVLAWIGISHLLDARFGFSESSQTSLAEADRLANLSLQHNPFEPHAVYLRGIVLAIRGRFEEAIEVLISAVKLCPSDAFLQIGLARTLVICGRAKEAETPVRRAMRLNPFYPNYYRGVLANVLEELRRVDEAIDILEESILHDPDYFSGHLRLASLLGLSDRIDSAQRQCEHVLRINPKFNLSHAETFYPTAVPESLERFVAGLRLAGLPERA